MRQGVQTGRENYTEQHQRTWPAIDHLVAAKMLFPFQCLVARSSSLEGSKGWHLIGASGSKLVAQSSTGTTATWTQQEDHVIVSEKH
jgi:hypothetical protein